MLTANPVFDKDGVEELIDLRRGGYEAKAYQARWVRAVILKYRRGGED